MDDRRLLHLHRFLPRYRTGAEGRYSIGATSMIKIRVSKPALEEFKHSEYGSYEDADCPDTGHVWCILDRHSGAIEIRDDDEAAEDDDRLSEPC
jgi:hypothetical protein